MTKRSKSKSKPQPEFIKDWVRIPLIDGPLTPESVARHDAETKAYWTAERRAAAKPMPLPTTSDVQLPPEPLGFTTTQVGNVTVAPYQSIGKTFFNSGLSSATCSASLVGSSLLLTAAHCLYDPKTGSYASRISFSPQYANGSPQGSWTVLDFFLPQQFYNSTPTTTLTQYDYGFMRLINTINLPALPILFSAPAAGSSTTSIGYPAQAIPGYDFDGDYQWQCVANLYRTKTTLFMSNNMTQGCSGGPWIVGGQIVGLNSTGSTGTINAPMFDALTKTICDQASGLSKEWTFDLNHSGHNDAVVAMAEGVVVAGSEGYVYAIDQATGESLGYNSLDGMGNNDIRIALRLTPSGNYVVFVGINGNVLALDVNDIGGPALWGPLELPTTSGSLVNVLWDGTNLFAGCAGHVYWIDPDTGTLIDQNSLSSVGSEECRLTSDGTSLFVGTDSAVIRIDLGTPVNSTFSTIVWTETLSKGDDIVSVVYLNGYVYAGSYGFIYQYATDGTLGGTNGLSGMGNDEVRLFSDGYKIYFGTYGYTGQIDPSNFTTCVWSDELPKVGRDIVDITVLNNYLFVGCDGYAFQYSTAGKTPLASNNLKGFGYHNVSVATDGFMVACGIWGWVVGMNASNFTGTLVSEGEVLAAK